MPDLKPIFSYRKWQFRNRTYPSAPWHYIIGQYELDLLMKHPNKFEIRYLGKDATIWQNTRQSAVK